jgi:hypothetical protein
MSAFQTFWRKLFLYLNLKNSIGDVRLGHFCVSHWRGQKLEKLFDLQPDPGNLSKSRRSQDKERSLPRRIIRQDVSEVSSEAKR